MRPMSGICGLCLRRKSVGVVDAMPSGLALISASIFTSSARCVGSRSSSSGSLGSGEKDDPQAEYPRAENEGRDMAIAEETCVDAHEAAVDVVPKARPCEDALATNWLPALSAMPPCCIMTSAVDRVGPTHKRSMSSCVGAAGFTAMGGRCASCAGTQSSRELL